MRPDQLWRGHFNSRDTRSDVIDPADEHHREKAVKVQQGPTWFEPGELELLSEIHEHPKNPQQTGQHESTGSEANEQQGWVGGKLRVVAGQRSLEIEHNGQDGQD